MDNKYKTGQVSIIDDGHHYSMRHRDSDTTTDIHFIKMTDEPMVVSDGIFIQDLLRVGAMRLYYHCMKDALPQRVKALESILLALQAMDESVEYREYLGIYHTGKTDCLAPYYNKKGIPKHIEMLYSDLITTNKNACTQHTI